MVQVAAPKDSICQVRTVERPDENLGALQFQFADDVALHAVRSRRGERMKRDPRKIVAQHTELPVLRTEVVSPLADAVRLVDGYEAHSGLPQHPAKGHAAVTDDALR